MLANLLLKHIQKNLQREVKKERKAEKKRKRVEICLTPIRRREPGWAWRRSRWWWGGWSTSSSTRCPRRHWSTHRREILHHQSLTFLISNLQYKHTFLNKWHTSIIWQIEFRPRIKPPFPWKILQQCQMAKVVQKHRGPYVSLWKKISFSAMLHAWNPVKTNCIIHPWSKSVMQNKLSHYNPSPTCSHHRNVAPRA